MTDTTDQAKILDRVRKLLTKAEANGTTDAEREALNAKAAELIAKYAINEAELASNGGSTDEMVVMEFEIDADETEMQARLMCAVAKSLRCQPIMMNGRTEVHVVGYESDIERAKILWTSLHLQMIDGVVRAVPYRNQSMRKGWMVGFIAAIRERLQAAERAAEQAAAADGRPGVALVLADRASLVESAFKREYPNVAYSRVGGSASMHGAGYAAGQRANFGGTGVQGGGRAALGR